MAGTPFTALSWERGGGHTNVSHWIRTWVSPNKRVAIEKQAHTIYGQDKGAIFSLLYTPSAVLLKSVTSEASAFLCMP